MTIAASQLRTQWNNLGQVSFTPPLLFYGAGAALLYLIVPPLVILVQTSLWVSEGLTEGRVSFGNYAAILKSPDLLTVLWNTFAFALGSSAVGLIGGSVLAWLVERTDTPFKQVAYPAAFIGLAVPTIIWAIGWVLLLGPRNGVLNVWLQNLLHLESAPFNIYTLPGMILVEGLLWIPPVFLLMAVPFRSMDPSLEEAAAASGASTWQTFRRVTGPLAAPAFLSILLLTTVRTLEVFELPAIVGIPGRVYVLTTEIYVKVHGGLFPDYGFASAYAVIMMALTSIGIYFYSQVTRRAQRYQTISGKAYRPGLIKLGRARYPAAAVVLLLPMLIAMPFAILVWASLQPFYSVPSLEGFSKLTLVHFVNAFTNSNVQSALFNTLVTGAVSATGALLLTVVVAWVILRTEIPGRISLDYLVSVALVFPGIVLGVALLRTYLTLPIPIYGTIWILVVAYITRFLPYAMRYAYAGLIQIHRELEESAHMSGAGWVTTFSRVLVPLMMPALFGAWLWVFLFAARELTVTVFLVGPRSQVLASTIYSLWTGGQLLEMAAFSVAVTTAFVFLALVLQRVSQRWGLQL